MGWLFSLQQLGYKEKEYKQMYCNKEVNLPIKLTKIYFFSAQMFC